MASPEPDYMHYLAILKASYDYAPQSEDEVEIKEDQLLLLVERVDDDWWKVKIKGESQDDEGPVGLVPAAYVEQAEHTSLVKVLYDYDAAAEGELSVKEDDILRVFETEGDWILAQSQSEDAAGYVPGNYVEATSGEAAPEPVAAPIVVPESPARPLSNYEDPAVRVQTHKLSADDIKTWSVSELDKKGKKKKGTLGIGNGSLFFASESDKTAVQKWQTSDVIDASIDKPKHLLVEVGGPNATTLHFHAGSKDNAEEILAKVHSSKAIATASSSPDGSSAPTAARRIPPLADSTPRAANKGVHFSESSPVIIPVAPRVEQEEEEEEEEASADGEVATALYDFKADGEDELSVSEGEQLLILERDGDEWWKCRNANGTEGVVPAQYLELQDGAGGVAATSSVAASQEEEDDDAAEEEANRLREQEQREAAEKQKREAEAAKARKQQAAQQKALAAEAERKRQLEAREKQIAAKPKSPTRSDTNDSSSSSTKPEPLSRPPPEKTRTWHDRSGQFRVDAAFLGFSNGKLRLHKTNGVVVEVPAEKMSSEDMRYVERLVKKQRAHSGMSDEDVPLAISAKVKNGSVPSSGATRVAPPPKKAPQIDWFDFFLGAGCDIDDCTRYAAAFERDKIDETILPDVTDSTMRSLGLKEGDIIRVKKAIEKRKPNENLNKPSPYIADQIRRDEELAKQLQAQESGKPAPNLFAGPGGVLKAPRRGRPQPKGSLPLSNVDIKAIDSASDTIQRTGSPRSATPVSSTPSATNAVQAPPRSSSALAKPSSGFEDDAWTVRPSSTKPLVGTPPSATPRIPSAPPAEPTPAPPPPAAATPAPAPASQPAQTASPAAPNLAKTTESDIFDQLARLSALRVTSSPAPPPQQSTPQPLSATPSIQTPPSFQMGMGMSNSPLPLGHLQANAPSLSPSPQFNGPRGPYAPVPANQGLLQPLIPTQTGFNSFVPTRAPTMNAPPLPSMQNNMMQPNMNSLSPPPQLSPLMLQQTGMMLPQQTGMPMNGSGFVQGSPFNGGTPMHSFPNNSGFGGQTMQPLQPQFTSFNPSAGGNFNGNSFNGLASAAPAPQAPKDNTPANIFASMKSGTFEEDNNQNNNGPQPAGMYDALRVNPTPLQMQPTGWGQPQQNFGMGYR
ncbi:hypothetical protein D9611_007701 [Ephemerocybe angulata]|uniref:Actin cytoskeleton-regulatory complex protein SLA1 n=1 Tax=Ephemerocybe angulata TaxID=980116 RepID=A0A8H5BZ57_9AGAR|nr:hypothetical protein D9611_007701 [Tulosesus angulatus]